jgi:hypothetical protein
MCVFLWEKSRHLKTHRVLAEIKYDETLVRKRTQSTSAVLISSLFV